MTSGDDRLLQNSETASISQEGAKSTQQNPINLHHVNKMFLMNIYYQSLIFVIVLLNTGRPA
jgi:hypothetical protein